MWAVDAEHAFTYCFPRDCPRILLWALPGPTAADRERVAVTPERVEVVVDLPAALHAAGVEPRVRDRLTPLRGVWATSLHVSGFRLRNARDWAAPPGAR